MPLTADEEKAFQDKLVATLTGEEGPISKAISSAIRVIVPGIVSSNLEAAIKKVTDPISASLEALKKGGNPNPNPDPNKDKNGESDDVKALRLRFETSEKALADERAAAKAARIQSTFLKAWASKGLKGGEYAYPRFAGKLTEDASGLVKIAVQRKLAGQSFDEQVEVDAWVEEFIKTDEAKMFVPADGAGGSGGGSGEEQFRRSGQKLTEEQLVIAALSGGLG